MTTSTPHGFRKWLPLVIFSLAAFITALDSNLLNVALPTIVAEFHTTLKALQWVISAYALVIATFTITGGRLGDFVGRRNIFIYGALLFGIGSLIAALSHSTGTLILGESVIEGLGAGMMVPATVALIMATYDGHDRTVAFSVWTAVAAIALVIGPVLGGYFTVDLSWRYGFLINVFVVAALISGAFSVKNARDLSKKTGIDVVGVLLSALSMFLIVFGIIESSDFGLITAKQVFAIGSHAIAFPGNLSVSIVSLVVGFLVLIGFLAYESYHERHGRTPIISLSIFKNGQFSVGLVVNFLQYVGLGATSFIIVIFLQAVRGMNALQAAFSIVPYATAMFLGSLISPSMTRRFSPKAVFQFGYVVMIAGLILLWTEIGINSTLITILPGMAVYGFGLGFVVPHFTAITLSSVHSKEVGEASGVLNTLRQVALSISIAVAGAILIAGIGSHLVRGVVASSDLSPSDKSMALSASTGNISELEFSNQQGIESITGLSPESSTALQGIVRNSVTASSRTALLANIALVFAAFLTTFGLARRKKDLP